VTAAATGERPRTDRYAIASVVTVLIGIPVLPIWLGFRSRKRIQSSEGLLKGEDIARVGIVLGFIQLAIFIQALLYLDPNTIFNSASATGDGVGCGPGPSDAGTFRDALNFIVQERESISGGVCIGGPAELWELGQSHMKVSLVAILVATLITVPIGLWLGHIGRGEFLAVSVSNVGRAVPSLALLAFFVAFLGLGFVNVAAVLTLLAIPPILTNTYVGVRQVDRETVDAARGIGMTETQIIRQVELPLAISTIFGGLRLSAVAVVATATIAPLGNVRSLGNPIIEPQIYGLPGQIGAAIVVALLTLAVDAGLGVVQRAATPAGLKVSQREKSKRFSLSIPWRTETS
jgi:osmoprotectant transport system permease protein